MNYSVKIDGVTLPTPSDITYVNADFDSEDSGRTETGQLIRDRIRSNVPAHEITWIVPTSKLKMIYDNLKKESFTAEITDPVETGNKVTYKAYRQGTIKRTRTIRRPDEDWWTVSVAIIGY